MPVLKTLIGANLINVGMIVTRFFGGTKLGTGGLARAYAGASNLAIQGASIIEWKRIAKIKHHAPFATSSNIEQQIKILGLNVLDRQFMADGVTFTIEGAEDDIKRFEAGLID
jgi:putative IMPACT (imprinted ancient) family translation regulator